MKTRYCLMAAAATALVTAAALIIARFAQQGHWADLITLILILIAGITGALLLCRHKPSLKHLFRRKQSAAEQAEEDRSFKNSFLSSMSHEIRTPMNAIVGMAQIAKCTDNPNKTNRCLEKIEHNSKHLLGIINDVLDYSKIESGKFVLDPAEFSLKDDLDFVLSMIGVKAAEKRLELKFTTKGITHDQVTADMTRLNQVLINLLSNAVKFTEPGGTIELSAEQLMHRDGQGTYRFAVRDTGIGIDEAFQARLFEPFEQANPHIATQYGGTGLGLSISSNIVALMGGQIEVESKKGEGSVFQFTLAIPAEKVARSEAAQPEDEAVEAADYTNRRFLVVDDIEINREIILELLKETGAKMESAANGKIAYDMFCASPVGYYDLVFMDMQMPVMDGCAATMEIRDSQRPDAEEVKILAMTANVMREDVQRVMDCGMNGHIGKPIDFGAMLRLINEVLG